MRGITLGLTLTTVLLGCSGSDAPGPLPPPSDLTVSTTSPTTAMLQWAAPSDGDAGTVIERRADGAEFAEVATVERGTTAHLDSGLVPGGTYDYRARAGSAGSKFGKVATVTTPIDFHVVPGEDSSTPNGGAETPFETIQQAAEFIDPAWTCEVVIHPGRHELPDNVVLPGGASLTIQAGATLALGSRVTFLATRPVTAQGTAKAPIVLTWLVPDEPWGVFVVSGAGADGTVFSDCIVEHGGFGAIGGIGYTGALSIFDAEATVSRCTFRDNTGDDSLNIKRAYSLVEHCSFFGGNDALDFDGAPGEIAYNDFHDTANDCIDTGEGATPLVHFNYVENAGDKGVSIGEGAAPTVEHNVIVGSALGIAIKDSSEPVIAYNTLVGNQVGVIGYEGIDGLGGGRGTVRNSIIWGSVVADVQLFDGSTTVFEYNCIEDGWPGTGNISAAAGCPDPLFHDPAAGDYHLQSQYGRWDPTGQNFVNDAATSPCIDAGDPAGDYTLEPEPNGDRANLGADGNTAEASRSAN